MKEGVLHHSSQEEPRPEEKGLYERIDALLRDKDTAFAKLLEAISPKHGEEYLNSKLKRFLDLSIAIPAAVIATPMIAVLGIAKKLEDGGTAFFIQRRYHTIPDYPDGEAQEDTFDVYKIRSMVEGAEKTAASVAGEGTAERLDPRATILGKTMRKYKLDELPQLYQVVLGQLSAIGVRPLSRESIQKFTSNIKTPEALARYRGWAHNYDKGKKGLTGLHQVRESGVRLHNEIFHYDTFYTKNANLGLDLYLLWATIGRILGKHPRRVPRIKTAKE